MWFCHPIYTEELSNSMLEVMACGIPVPATPVGAISDVIIDEKARFMWDIISLGPSW